MRFGRAAVGDAIQPKPQLFTFVPLGATEKLQPNWTAQAGFVSFEQVFQSNFVGQFALSATRLNPDGCVNQHHAPSAIRRLDLVIGRRVVEGALA